MNKFLGPRTVRLRLSVKSSRKSRTPQPQTLETQKACNLNYILQSVGVYRGARRLRLTRFVVKNKQEMNEFFSGIIPKCANVLPHPLGSLKTAIHQTILEAKEAPPPPSSAHFLESTTHPRHLS